MRRHAELCEPLGPGECPGCEDWAIAIGRARALRRALRAALAQVSHLARDLEGLALSSDPEDEHPICRSAIAAARRGRRVAARLAPLAEARLP